MGRISDSSRSDRSQLEEEASTPITGQCYVVGWHQVAFATVKGKVRVNRSGGGGRRLG